MTTDPLAHTGHFALEIDGIEVAWFLGCSGLSGKTEVKEIPEGGLLDRVHLRPGLVTWEPLVLRAATSVSPALWDWREAWRTGSDETIRTGAVIVYDESGEEARRYELSDVWPVRWQGPGLNAERAELAVEELELGHHGIVVR